MDDFLVLAGAPLDEDCVQVDSRVNYLLPMRQELNRFKRMLRDRFPIPIEKKEDVYFFVHWQSHDFGRYGEIGIRFKGEDGEEFAYFVEENLPKIWNDSAVLTFDNWKGE